MDQRRKRKEETAQTVSFPKSSEPLQISERTLRMLRQNTAYERNDQPQNNIVSNPAASRGMGGHSMGGKVRKPSVQSAPQAQLNLNSALSAGASGNPLAMAAGPTRLYTPEEISVRAQAQRQAQQNLNAGMVTGGSINPVAAAGAMPTTGDLARAFRVDPTVPVPTKKLWRRTEEPAFNGALQTGQAGNPLYLAGAGPTPIDLMRDHYNERVPTPSPVGEQTFAEGGQFDAQSGRTYFSNNGNPVWAQVQDLEGIGVLSDGSVVGHLSNDRFARPLYEIIKARDTGEMDPIDAAERIDMLAWEMAIQKYPKFDDVYNRVNAYKDNLRRIKTRKLEYYDIPDVTERMNEIIEKAEEDSIRLIIDCMLSPEVDDRRKYSLFYEHVASGKEYDLKQWPEFQEHALFMLDGEIVSRDALGNILYGYLGKAYGFSDSDLFDGAGLAQIMDRNSKWTWGETHFDDPRDQKRIQQGISLYLKTH